MKIITYQPKAFENPNIVDIKSVITENPKTSQAEKVGSNSSFYSYTKKRKIFKQKNLKITKPKHAF